MLGEQCKKSDCLQINILLLFFFVFYFLLMRLLSVMPPLETILNFQLYYHILYFCQIWLFFASFSITLEIYQDQFLLLNT